MSRLLARIYLITTILVLVGITALFFWRLYSVRAVQENTAAESFRELSGDIATLWSDNELPAAGDALSTTLERSHEVTPEQPEESTSEREANAAPEHMPPIVVGVYSFDRGIDYLWARDGRFLADGMVVEHGVAPVISSNEIVHRRYTRSFELPDGERRIVTAVYSVLDSHVAYAALRDTFVALLAAVAGGLTVAIIHLAASRRTAGASVSERVAPPVPTVSEAPSPSPAAPDIADGAAQDSSPDDAEESVAGLVPRTDLKRRLTLELERAGFYEQDLSVALFEFFDENGTVDDAAFAQSADAVLSFFAFEDLCFDAGDKRIAAIFPNTTLRENLAQIERFQHFYWEQRRTWNRSEADFVCGVSARNGRLVDGERIIGECSAALRRAKGTPGRIMGFQPDPQRYREFLSGQSG
ncbi:MAG: hypothetical protein MI724_03765 [Spirochaetales bacterium]|nr:hypothetical protein [Spirochaetales bacterium]